MTEKGLPSNAKLVFKGRIFNVYQWEQEMYDGKKEIFEVLKRPDTSQVLATIGNKILILEQEQPNTGKFISLPGGRLLDDEDPLDGAKRELLEETGYESADWTLWKTFKPIPKVFFNIFIYLAKNCILRQPPNPESGEKIKPMLVTFDEFLMLSDNPEAFRQKELASFLMELRLHTDKKKRFKNMLWPKSFHSIDR